MSAPVRIAPDPAAPTPEEHHPLREISLPPPHSGDADLELRPLCASGLGILWLLLGAAALIGGIRFASPAIFAAGVLLFALPLLLLLGLARVASGLRVTRHSPTSAHEGQEIVVELRLENRSRWTCHFPRVSEIFPPEIHAQKDVIVTDRLLPGESASARYVGTAILPRGIYTVGPTAIRLADPFGWFEVRRRLPRRGELRIHPALVELDVPERGGGAVAAIVENLVAREIGDEDELRGVREYRRGDSPRRIHWPLTARHRTPVVKEFHPAVTGDLSIVLDLHRRAGAGLGRASTVETAIRIAGSVARESLRMGHRVELVAGRDPARLVPLAGGREQEREILDALVPLRANDPEPLDEWLAVALARVPRGSAALLFISPYLLRDGPWLAAVGNALRRGVRIIATLFDERSYVQVWRDAAAALPAERVAERLRAEGASVVIVPCGSDLPELFAAPRAAGARGRGAP